ncbi:HAD family hydrolase [Amycolatopsis sp. NPDC059027]|uniref:HAD family hydrolase n=1 Tax=Amycolatopsis sp. NPDC059027 TaxID=3346709 RepID=UPI00366C32F5
MVGVTELLADRDHVFVGFDGVVCTVFDTTGARTAADRLKPLVGHVLPDEVAATGDPFAVLSYAASCGPNTADAVHRQLARLELEALVVAGPVPGSVELIGELAWRGFTVTAVGNQSMDAVRSHLSLHDLQYEVKRISARASGDPALLLPGTALIDAAVRGVGASPDQCVLIGGTPPELQAARAAGVATIAVAPVAPLTPPPDVVVADLAELRLAG